MRQETEIDYLCRRAAEELDLADASRDPTVTFVHRELAALYAGKVAELRGAELLTVEIMPSMSLPPISAG